MTSQQGRADGPHEQVVPFVGVRNLTKTYGKLEVLKDISLTVERGEVLAIVGPSGSGKSTLLRCLNLLEVPSGGQMTACGVTIDCDRKISGGQRRGMRRNLGMVFQSFNLFPHMTVLENICLPQRRVLGRGRDEAEQVALALLDKVGLRAKAQSYPTRCSGGQQQRIAIARALALDPQLMLFDEPTSALDPELGQEVLAVMTELAQSGMTMIVVTHEMGFAEKVSDRTVFMADGFIVESGPSEQVIRAPRSERAQRFFSAVNGR